MRHVGGLTDYIEAAMRHARYEIFEEDGTFYGEIPECPGVLANRDTLEACRDDLRSVLEGWIIVGLAFHDPFPEIDGIGIVAPTVPVPA